MADIAYADIANLTDREVQMLLREVDTKDLAVAMMDGNEAVNAKYFANVSDRVAGMLRDEMATLSPVPEDIAQVQGRIVDTLEQLREARVVTWPRELEVPKPKSTLSQDYLDQKAALEKQLAGVSFMTLSKADLASLFLQLANVARAEGILTMGKLVPSNDDDFLCLGIHLAVDGTEPSLIEIILETRIHFLSQYYVSLYQMMLEALLSLHSGDNARIIEIKLKTFYVAPGRNRKQNPSITLSDIQTRLQEKPISQSDIVDVADLLTDMAFVARRDGLRTLDAIVPLIDDAFLAQGLRLVVDGTLFELVQEMLETRLASWETYFETKCEMVKTGILSIQAGNNPRIIEQKLRNYFDFV